MLINMFPALECCFKFGFLSSFLPLNRPGSKKHILIKCSLVGYGKLGNFSYRVFSVGSQLKTSRSFQVIPVPA